MTQVFSRRADTRFRIALWLIAAAVLLAAGVAFAAARSGLTWRVGVPAPQPIPFSHAIHAGELGLDCRFCHAGVERVASAGMPTAQTCLGCHERVWNVAAQFAPLTTALALDAPVEWSSVHRLPEHSRFHHGAHTAAGAACETCHGKVWEMARTVKAETLHMGWCLDCHRDPAPLLRPVGAVFDRDYQGPPAPPGQAAERIPHLGAETVSHLGIEIPFLTRCSTCHR